MVNFSVHNNPLEAYQKMLSDIASAKECIYLETYIYDNDEIGKKFRDALIKKAEQGVEVKILIDAFGATVDKNFFKTLTDKGGEVKFFREIQYVLRTFSKNHERNHRKLLLVDHKISYIGSINITRDCLDWRELILRLEGDITAHFQRSFKRSWSHSANLNPRNMNKVLHKSFEIIQDLPSTVRRTTEKRYTALLRHAQKRILIETPYFVPSSAIRKAIIKATERGVEVIIILPYISDVRIVDIMRNIYLGRLYLRGVKIYYYKPRILHSKLLLVDNDFFLMGSSNLDYRSFLHQYEINLLGKDKRIIVALHQHAQETLKDSVPFDYGEWKQRSTLIRMAEILLSRVRKYF